MELMTLDSDFQPNRLVENYESLIWTERYSSAGDFELTSTNVPEAITSLPLNSFVTLRESTVPMVVEIHKIEKKKNSAPQITVSGTSFETVLSRRVALQTAVGTPRTTWMISADKESDAAYKAIRTVLGDVARFKDGAEVLPSIAPVMAMDAIPEIDLILPADYSTGTTNSYEIKSGDLYSTVLELIQVNRRGIKAVRPNTSSTQVGIEIYNGADLTDTVVFDARFDQFDDATYLLSDAGSKGVAYVYGATGSQVVLKTAAPEPSGLNRRVLLVDQASDATADDADTRRTRGLIELYKYNATALFDGQIAEQVASGYNTRYHLGDILKLTGEYGLSQNVRVAEFIRSSDKSGEKSFPAFDAVD